MLSPEVCNFPPPKTGKKLLRELSSETIDKKLSEKSLYHNILLVCVDTAVDVPSQVKDIFRDSSYYKLSNVSLSALLEKDFIEGYIDKGSFSCLNIGVDANIDNIVSITDGGHLELLLNYQTYHKFGINGTVIKRKKNTATHYVKIKLSGNLFKSNKSYYNRLYEQSKLLENLTFIVSWQPSDDTVCPSSLAKYFSIKGITVETCTPTLSIKKQHLTNIPSICESNIDEVIEWIGMVAVGGDLVPNEDFLSKYSNDFAKHSGQGFVVAYHINGFFTSNFTIQLQNMLRKSMHSSCDWYSLSLQTFTDAPKAKWIGEQNSMPEDNVLTFVIKNDKSLLVEWFRNY